MARNHGADLQVYYGHHDSAGQHQPWHNSHNSHNPGWKPELAAQNSDRGDLEKLVDSSPSPPERKILNLSIPTFILSCILFVVTAGLVIVGGLLGHKVANLESTVPGLAINTTNTANNTTNPGNMPAASNTDPDATSPPLQPKVSVAGWDYIGCYYDTKGRILTGENQTGGNPRMTNDVCASFCLSSVAEGSSKPRHFGTEIADQCYCGDLTEEVRATGRAPDWMCSRQCKGRDGLTENCGGNWVLSVYERQGD